MQTSRNAPCPCGSGRKYKVCCLAKDEAQHKPRIDKDALIVCMPTRGQITYETELALRETLRGFDALFCTIGRKPVVEARNWLARSALSAIDANPLAFTPREWFILWIDDDAWWQQGTVQILVDGLRKDRATDVVFGLFGNRTPYAGPAAFRNANDLQSFPKMGVDCRQGDLIPIERAGFHFVLMRESALRRVGPDPFTPRRAHGEDFEFCERAVEAGLSLKVATGVPIAHLDPRDGTAYFVGMAPMMMDGNVVRAMSLTHATPQGVKEAELREYGEQIGDAAAREREALSEIESEMQQRRKVAEGAV